MKLEYFIPYLGKQVTMKRERPRNVGDPPVYDDFVGRLHAIKEHSNICLIGTWKSSDTSKLDIKASEVVQIHAC